MNVSLSVVVPVYRNAATLAELHRRLGASIRPETTAYEILFVVDACPEDSLVVLRDIAARDPRVGILSLASNVGQNRAVLLGLAHAGGARIVVMDADLQDPPEAIPVLLDALDVRDVDVVFAGRRGRYESGVRLLTSRAFKLLLHAASDGRIPRDAGLFLAMSRRALEALMRTSDAAPHVVALLGRTKLPLASVPVLRAAPVGPTTYTSQMRLRLGAHALRCVLGIGWRASAADGEHADAHRAAEWIEPRMHAPPTGGER